MKSKFNRFALLPKMCNICHEIMWLERYRRADVYHCFLDGCMKENICKRCIDKYNVGK